MRVDPDAVRLEFRRPFRALGLVGVSIGIIIFGVALAWVMGVPASTPFPLSHVILGSMGAFLGLRRILVPRLIVLSKAERVVKMSGMGLFATGGGVYTFEQVSLELRPALITNRRFLGANKRGTILLLRSPNDVTAICMAPTMSVVQAYLDRILAVVPLRVEHLRRSAITWDA
ncbi:MAG: hypothetical protein JNL50_14140 [Phycisphaerae bacterium]|nr:hypothetical protein [Phycisphaerae bacterium]